jgi:hydrogenase nickel incorporation protein HypA/HybF
MHEYGIALEIANLVAEKAAGRTVIAISLRVGALSGISGDSVSMYLDLVFREKSEKVPRITIEQAPASLQCACGNRYTAEKMFDPCPQCGGFDRTVLDGTECTIESIEVDDE